jgi:hypothetical protein
MQFSTSGGKSLVKLAKNSWYDIKYPRDSLNDYRIFQQQRLITSRHSMAYYAMLWPVRTIKFNAKSHESKVFTKDYYRAQLSA